MAVRLQELSLVVHILAILRLQLLHNLSLAISQRRRTKQSIPGVTSLTATCTLTLHHHWIPTHSHTLPLPLLAPLPHQQYTQDSGQSADGAGTDVGSGTREGGASVSESAAGDGGDDGEGVSEGGGGEVVPGAGPGVIIDQEAVSCVWFFILSSLYTYIHTHVHGCKSIRNTIRRICMQ